MVGYRNSLIRRAPSLDSQPNEGVALPNCGASRGWFGPWFCTTVGEVGAMITLIARLGRPECSGLRRSGKSADRRSFACGRIFRPRQKMRGRVSLVAAVIVALVVPAAASANYYGIAAWSKVNTGAIADESSSAFSISDPTNNDFVDNDLWVVQTSGCGKAQCWIESGIIEGTFCSSNPNANNPCPSGNVYTVTSPTYFWTDDRPNGGGYHAHLGGAATLPFDAGAVIFNQGGGKWLVSGGDVEGTSTNNFTSSNELEAGTETTNTATASVCSDQSGLEWRDSSGTFNDDWPGAGLDVDNPPYASWAARGEVKDWDNHSC